MRRSGVSCAEGGRFHGWGGKPGFVLGRQGEHSVRGFGGLCRCRGRGRTQAPQGAAGGRNNRNQVLPHALCSAGASSSCPTGSPGVPRKRLHGCRTGRRCPCPAGKRGRTGLAHDMAGCFDGSSGARGCTRALYQRGVQSPGSSGSWEKGRVRMVGCGHSSRLPGRAEEGPPGSEDRFAREAPLCAWPKRFPPHLRRRLAASGRKREAYV